MRARVLIVAAASLVVVGAARAGSPAVTDRDALQGTWRLAAVAFRRPERDDPPHPAARGDVEEYAGRNVRPEDNGYLSERHAEDARAELGGLEEAVASAAKLADLGDEFHVDYVEPELRLRGSLGDATRRVAIVGSRLTDEYGDDVARSMSSRL